MVPNVARFDNIMIWNNENMDIEIKVKQAVNNVLFCNDVNDRQVKELMPKKKFRIKEIVRINPNIINKINGMLGMIIVAV